MGRTARKEEGGGSGHGGVDEDRFSLRDATDSVRATNNSVRDKIDSAGVAIDVAHATASSFQAELQALKSEMDEKAKFNKARFQEMNEMLDELRGEMDRMHEENTVRLLELDGKMKRELDENRNTVNLEIQKFEESIEPRLAALELYTRPHMPRRVRLGTPSKA